MNKNNPDWYKKLVYDCKELKAEVEAEKLRIKIEIGKELLLYKDKLDEKYLRKLSRGIKEKLMDLDVKLRDMPCELRSWMLLAEKLEIEKEKRIMED